MPKDFDLPQKLDLIQVYTRCVDATGSRNFAPGRAEIIPFLFYTNVKGVLKPVDKLSSKARESGPVRARGMQGNRGGYQTLSGVNIPRPQTLLEHDLSERPVKRRRRDIQGSPTESFIDLSDDNETGHSVTGSSSVIGNTARLSPGSSQQSLKAHKSKRSNRNAVDEFRQVEKNMRATRSQVSPKLGAKRFRHRFSPEDELEQCFTENAARERRFSTPSVKHEVLQSVEIQKPRRPDRSGSPSLHGHPTNERRDSESRESPDELQGAATVQPAQDLSREFRKKDVRGGINTGKQVAQRKSSPADIRPTVFVPSSHQGKFKRKITKSGTRPSADRCFQATSVRFGTITGPSSGDKAVELHVDPINETIKMAGPDPANSFQIPFNKVFKIFRGTSPSCKVRLALREGTGDQLVDIDLTSPEAKEDLYALLAASGAKVVEKDGKWMDDAFKKNENTKTSGRYLNGIKRSCTERAPEQGSETTVEVSKRPKLSASLQNDLKPNVVSQSGPRDSSSSSGLAQKSRETASDETMKATSVKAGTEEAVEIPVKKYTGEATASSRATRSTTRRMLPATVVSDDEEENSPQQQCEKISRKWQRPLVYPRFGKKKAEVNGQDLERLRDNEFLNDNLIGFYIRFLEDHLERNNKEVSKRVYFFNSYFFATLTNLPRGKQGINYEGVQKWTRNVDIFSYDYIVVPINEAAHWYVAIICNLPKLPGIVKDEVVIDEHAEGDTEPSALPKRDDSENPNTPQAVGSMPSDSGGAETGARSVPNPEKEELARESLAAMSLLDRKEMKERGELEVPPSDEEWPEKEENPVSSPAKLSSPPRDTEPSTQVNSQDARQSSVSGSQKSRKPKKKRQGPRYEVWQPTVITFDSLNLSRSPTISVLRNYLREEAQSKRGVEIDTTLIKGMKAQEIPLQPNYSDCGLYLLAYVEKFVQDPDTFVTKLLRRDMRVEDDWPLLRSGLLRSRLRKFLDELYDEQEQLSREKAAERATMADRQPISYLLGHSEGKTDLAAENMEDASATRSEKSPSRNPPLEKSGLEPAQKAKLGESRSVTRSSSRDGTPDSKAQAKRSTPQTLAASASGSTTRKEVVEVPDSQEQVQPEDVTSHCLLHVEDSQSGQAPFRPQGPKPVDEDAERIQIPHQSADGSIVEIQVLGTPPPGLSTDKPDGVRKSPRSLKKRV
ncbi:putative Ulp1 protease [Aspergillus fischeri NRRL 181]|uniref:Ulp1 protease, putative n=1 Tax=Neosartorya fischeri (strain ATCC 1020 / DSM 3700 / CBS 544.65 / FGSC A1164 / JCM 1740 / NRRL 181 / WB 181) TaxID=331117 RepID=A1CZZ7_NEOFI|nr:Ulp1 protease, putative [Aspergillus fischeri NRRL 181]EAW24317.1 Ulp1 protease, putative [Aspergillus fischeri NRRL 181]